MRIYEGTGTTASATNGSLTLEHVNAGGSSSLVFKGPSSTTSDYAYVQYEDAVVPSYLKFDLSSNVPATLSDIASITNTGTFGIGSALNFQTGHNQFAWYPNPPSINGVMPAYCISFNQTNVLSANTSAINFLQATTGQVAAGSRFSLSLWIRPTGLTFNQTYVRYQIAYIAASATSNVPVVEMWLEANTTGSERKIFVLFNNSFVGYKFSGVELSLDTWYHVAFVVGSNTTPVLYINGANVGALGGPDSLLTVSINAFDKLWLGARYDKRSGSDTQHMSVE